MTEPARRLFQESQAGGMSLWGRLRWRPDRDRIQCCSIHSSDPWAIITGNTLHNHSQSAQIMNPYKYEPWTRTSTDHEPIQVLPVLTYLPAPTITTQIINLNYSHKTTLHLNRTEQKKNNNYQTSSRTFFFYTQTQYNIAHFMSTLQMKVSRVLSLSTLSIT